MDNPLFLLLATAGGLYIAKLWNDDRKAARAGNPNPKALPGATDAPRRAVVIAVIGALVILAGETLGERVLGVDDEQSTMTWTFALYSIVGAAFIEELIFRGYLVVLGRGRGAMWASAIAASVLFALIHPFLWEWEEKFTLTLSVKGWFSTAAVFVTSLWFYTARLATWNPRQSLLPCFAGHAAKNLGVVAIKAATGFMGPLW